MIKRKSTAVILAALFLFGHKYVMAGPGADVDGHVWSGTTPLCALVLANGQSMFSCNPNGPFELSHVPLDGDGQVEVQIFVAGFAPFKQKITPSGAVSTVSLPQVNMLRVEQGRSFQVDATYVPSAKVGFVIVAGTVKAGGAPICTLVLANGQKLFTCNENLGKFSLEAPADQDGTVTLMIFAGGFQP